MTLGEVGSAVDGFVAALGRVAPGQVAALYLVGGAALGDFSARQSNVDLVLMGDPGLTADQRRGLRRAEHGLARARRPAEVWYTTWAEIADGPLAGPPPSTLETPLTRALLRSDAIAIGGPDWPVVAFDPAVFRAWCVDRLGQLQNGSTGSMLMRHDVTTLVLEAARLTQGAVTGRVFSKTEAGESVGPLVPAHFRRILTDSVGYRAGAHTSMYWGPYERKYDARALLRHLVDAAGQAV